MNVNGVHPPVQPQSIESNAAVTNDKASTAWVPAKDVVEISTVAKLAAKVQDIPDIRTDLVARVKQEIAAGTYETEERLEIAIDRLSEDLFE